METISTAKMDSVVDRINKENFKRFGDICVCGQFESYCRCESSRCFDLEMENLCTNCEEPVLSHRVCKCGYYKRKKVI